MKPACIVLISDNTNSINTCIPLQFSFFLNITLVVQNEMNGIIKVLSLKSTGLIINYVTCYCHFHLYNLLCT